MLLPVSWPVLRHIHGILRGGVGAREESPRRKAAGGSMMLDKPAPMMYACPCSDIWEGWVLVLLDNGGVSETGWEGEKPC